MKSFADISNINGAWPAITCKNCSGAGATDGTPAIQEWVNNFWGWIQDLLARVSITPSGVLEAYAAETGSLPLGTTATQWRTAFQLGSMEMPGKIILWARSQAPATVGARVLLLQGQTIVIANYKDLVAATYCGDGVNNTAGVPFYKSTDSGGVTRSTAGTYFTLPDARGVTIRGVDIGNTRDPLGSTRGGGTPNGSVELDAFQGHLSTVYVSSGVAADVTFSRITGSTTVGSSPQNLMPPSVAFGTDGSTYESRVNAAPRVAAETRMINMATYIGITY